MCHNGTVRTIQTKCVSVLICFCNSFAKEYHFINTHTNTNYYTVKDKREIDIDLEASANLCGFRGRFWMCGEKVVVLYHSHFGRNYEKNMLIYAPNNKSGFIESLWHKIGGGIFFVDNINCNQPEFELHSEIKSRHICCKPIQMWSNRIPLRTKQWNLASICVQSVFAWTSHLKVPNLIGSFKFHSFGSLWNVSLSARKVRMVHNFPNWFRFQ